MATRRIGNININYTVPEAQTQFYNALGRTEGAIQNTNTGSGDNFFTKTGKSLENTFGTTGAALASALYDKSENTKTKELLKDSKTRMNEIAQKYGFNSYQDVWDARELAEANGDQTTIDLIDNTINPQLQAQANTNADEANTKASAYDDYRKNNYVSQKINQDRGKFAGSAINTLNTMADVGLMAAGIPAGVALNSLQGAAGGVADELEQNGLENFDLKRAGQNALVGATTGAVTGALNKGLNKMVNPQTGNLFKGGNALTRGMNKLGSSTALGRLGSTIATGATRGAISGAVGGATGAGLSTALNGGNIGDVLGNAAQGAVQGAQSGAITGGTMAGINKVADATLNRLAPETAMAIRENQQRNKSYGEGLKNQFKGAWESGDSEFKQWLQGKPSKIIAGAANIGNRIVDISNKKLGDTVESYLRMVKDAEGVPLDSPRGQGIMEQYTKAAEDLRNNFTNDELVVLMQDNNDRYLDEVIGYALKMKDPSITVYSTVDPLGNRKEYTAQEVRQLIDEYENYKAPSILSGNSSSEVAEALGDAGVTLTEIFRNRNGGMFDPYSRADGEAFNNWVQSTKAELENTTDPTTIGGWIKRAGKRFVEDANQRGVGLGIKDVSGEEDFATALNRGMDQGLSGLELADELAQYSGLPNKVSWDEVRQLASNDQTLTDVLNNLRQDYIDVDGVAPTANDITGDLWDEIRARYALERNYQGPTPSPEQAIATRSTQTATNAWDRVAQEAGYNNYDEVVQAFHQANPNAQVNAGAVLTWLDNNPASANATAGLDQVFEPEARNQIEDKNKLQSIGQQLQSTSKQQKYRALYDSLDAKTAQRAVQTNAPERLADMDIKPENYLEAAKTSNYINQVMTDLADKSGVVVDVPDMTERLANAKGDVILTPTAEKEYYNTIKQIVADGSTPDEYSTGYLLQKSRELGDKAANVRGNKDDVNTLRSAYSNAKWVLRDLAGEAMADADITGPTTNQKIADGLAKMGANQKVIDYYTAPVDGGAPDAGDYIYRSSLFEQARDMGAQVKAEQLTRSASKQPTNLWTRMYRASGLDQPIELLLNNTIAPLAGTATNIAGKALEGAGNLVAKVSGNNTPTQTTATTASTTATNPSNWLYNAIGRTEGLSNAEQANTAQYLAAAAQEAEIVPKAPNAGVATLEDLAGATTTTTPTSVYDTVYGTQTTTGNSYFPTTGDYWTDILGSAMSMALDANDATAFGSLYNMYQNALAKQESATVSETKLTDKQRQANAAALALEDFANTDSNFAYDVSDIPVIGNIANLGGNEYQSKAEALALQVGYMLSGGQINKDEAKNIGMAYVPQPRDSEAVRQSKLNQIRGIISEYQRTYAS